jgi:hypothetical protein
MAASWGKIIYWAATFIAGLVVVSVAWSYAYNVEQGDPDCPFAICRSYLAGGMGLPLSAHRTLNLFVTALCLLD